MTDGTRPITRDNLSAQTIQFKGASCRIWTGPAIPVSNEPVYWDEASGMARFVKPELLVPSLDGHSSVPTYESVCGNARCLMPHHLVRVGSSPSQPQIVDPWPWERRSKRRGHVRAAIDRQIYAVHQGCHLWLGNTNRTHLYHLTDEAQLNVRVLIVGQAGFPPYALTCRNNRCVNPDHYFDPKAS